MVSGRASESPSARTLPCSTSRSVAPTAQRLAKQLLVVPPAVHVGRVEEVDALVERVTDRRNRLVVVRVAVHARHGHQAEADGGHLDAATAEWSLLRADH